MVSNCQLVVFGQIPQQQKWEKPSGLPITSSSPNLDSIWLILKMLICLHNGNSRFPQTLRTTKPLTWHHCDCSHVFSTVISCLYHQCIQVFKWIVVAFIYSTSVAQRKVCWALYRVVYRGKVSHVLSGVLLQMMTVGS